MTLHFTNVPAAALALVMVALTAVHADQSALPVAPAPAATTDEVIPAKTIVEIEITQDLSSKTNAIGDMFAIKLAAPLVLAGKTILPADIPGRGEVTHAAKSGWGGKAGELIVNARYLECGATHIPLGHFHFGIAGKNNVGGAFAAAQVVPFGQFLVSGHDAVIPAGGKGTAQVNAPVSAAMLKDCAPSH